MVIDDRTVVVGSANINDRSLCGNRDSELAAVIEDADAWWHPGSQEDAGPRVCGEPNDGGNRFATTLRIRIWAEFLGLPLPWEEAGLQEAASQALWDPVSDECWALWMGTARQNTEAFRDHFKVWPDSSQRTCQDVADTIAARRPLMVGSPEADAAKQALSRGHLIEHAIDFLSNEDILLPKP